MIGVGIVGAGGIVRARHAPGLRAQPDVRIVAVANSSVESARNFCREWCQEAEVCADWREVVRHPQVDAVLIGAGPYLHEVASVEALRAGKHVFCQARMATDLAAARRMLQAAEEHPELVTMLCPPPHGLRVDGFVRLLLAKGELGLVRAVRVRSFSGMFLDPEMPAHWRQRTEISGKNILTLGIYAEVLQRWFGRLEPVGAQADFYVPERGGTRIVIPDALVVLGRLQEGASVTLDLSGCHPGLAEDVIEIIGARAMLTVDAAKDEVRWSAGTESQVLPIPEELDRPWRVEADFLDAVRQPTAPRPHPDFRDGVAYMEVVEKVWNLLG